MTKLKFVLVSIALGFLLTLPNVQSNAQELKTKEKMKFLVIVEYKDLYYSLPSAERKKIDDADKVFAQKMNDQGDVLEVYYIPGWNRYVVIEQYENIEKLYEHFEEDPSFPYLKYEVYPIKQLVPAQE
jgi:muconolactone delta-isomerase